MKHIYVILIAILISGCDKKITPKKINLIRQNEIIINIEKEEGNTISNEEIIIPGFIR